MISVIEKKDSTIFIGVIVKLVQFLNQFQSILTKFCRVLVKQRFYQRSVGIPILLFIFSFIFSPVIAHSLSNPEAASFSSPPEVAQVSEPDLVEQAQSFYAQQKFAKAAAAWKQAVTFFTEQKDPLNQAVALSNLSLTYQQLGQWDSATQALTQSLALLQQLEPTRETAKVLAQTLDIQGQLELAKGHPEAALEAWKKALLMYPNTGNLTNITQNQINQAQALQTLGRYSRAEDLLEQTAQRLESQPNSAEKAIAFVSLGDVFRVMGKPDESQENLENGKVLAEQLNLPEVQAAALISLGNLARSSARFHQQEFYAQAQQHYQQALEIATSTTTQIQAQLNQLSLSVLTQDWTEAEKLQADIRQKLKQVPQNQTAIYSQLNLVQSLMCFAEAGAAPAQRKDFSPLLQSCFLRQENTQSAEEKHSTSVSWQEIRSLTLEAIQAAQQLQNTRAEAYALGYLAATYQQTQHFAKAEKYTRQALELESISSYEAGEITYLLQWQLGRLRQAQDRLQMQKPKKDQDPVAVQAYKVAFETLNSLRRDLLVISPEVQYTFRDRIEPLYREYVDLLLKPEKPSLDNLKQARTVIEALQLAEINDFFRDACTQARPEEIDTVVDTTKTPTTVIYPIILEDRIEVILKLPGEERFYHYRTLVKKQEVNTVLAAFRRSLANPVVRSSESETVYDWLIRPAERILAESQSTTLVFVLDGSLRKIPMAALYNSKEGKNLIEKYAIALAPGLQLLSPEPFSEISLNALLAGVSQEQTIEGRKKPFDPLPQVVQELNQIQTLVPLSDQPLLNDNFSISNLETQLNQTDLTLVHLATHGEFNSNVDDSFIVAWNELLTVREIDRILREQRSDQSIPIELLTLSACETAEGDDRALLGMAGVAVRAGARSTVATLWKVSDQSTAEFMKRLYEELLKANETGTVNKAKALQKVQLDFLTNSPDPDWKKPYYWASFVLIGNWF